jgi:hypothetical protein
LAVPCAPATRSGRPSSKCARLASCSAQSEETGLCLNTVRTIVDQRDHTSMKYLERSRRDMSQERTRQFQPRIRPGLPRRINALER